MLILLFLQFTSAVKLIDYNIESKFDLLIIGPSEAESLCLQYADFKNKLGVLTRVLTVEEISHNFNGSDLPEKIRNSIRFYRDNFGIRYVLIVGDFNKVPSRIAYINFSYSDLSNNVPTDFYYSELRSDWDKNKNGLYGEIEDSIIFSPEVMVGRIPYHTLQELGEYFEKARNYKTLWFLQPRAKALIHCADVIGNGLSYRSLAEPIVQKFPESFDISRLYEQGTSQNITKQQFTDSISAQNTYVVSITHGDFGGIYINNSPQLYYNSVDFSYVPPTPPAFWAILSCDIGGFDRDAFGEHILFHPSVIGLLSQTRDGVSNTYVFLQSFFQSLFQRLEVTLGQADSAYRANFGASVQNSQIYYYSLLTYVLFGDPTIVPKKNRYFKIPWYYVKAVSDTLIFVTFRVPITPEYSGPVRVILYKPGDFLKVVESESDSIYIPVAPKSDGFVYVTISGNSLVESLDSVYVKAYTNALAITLKEIRNFMGDSVLFANSWVNAIFKLKNNSSYEIEAHLEFTADSILQLQLRDALVYLGPGKMDSIILSGFIGPVLRDTLLKLIISSRVSNALRVDTFFLYVKKVRLLVDKFSVDSDSHSVTIGLKLFNPMTSSLRDIKVFLIEPEKILLDMIDSLGPRRDTLILLSFPYGTNLRLLGLFYLGDSLIIPVPEFSLILPPPSDLVAYPRTGSVFLRWRAPKKGLMYNVYKIEGCDTMKLNTLPLSSVTFEDYTARDLCGYFVTSVDTIRNLESTPSNVFFMKPNPPYFPGWPVPLLGSGYSTPVACELDAMSPGLEIVAASSFDSLIYAFDYRGRLLPGWPVNIHGTVLSAIAAGDVDGNGEEEVIFNIWNGVSRLHVLNKYGSEVSGFPVTLNGAGYSTPSIVDLDGDGRKDIVVKDAGFVKIFRYPYGLVRSSVNLGGPGTSPAVADLDGDGLYEIIVTYFQSDSGYVTVLDTSLNVKRGFPVKVNKNNITSPSVGDVDPMSEGPEIVLFAGDSLYIFSRDSSLLGRYYVGSLTYWPFAISPAIGDVDGDGIKDIAIPYANGIKVFKSDGRLVEGFPVNCGGGFSSCVLADIDGDGKCEIFKGSVTGTLDGYDYTGNSVKGFPIDLYSYAYPTPQIVDLDGNGTYELLASSFANSVFVYDTRWPMGTNSWPEYKHDRFRTGWAEYLTAQGLAEVRDEKYTNEKGKNTYEILIIDILGRVVFQGHTLNKEGFLTGNLKPGVYFIKSKNSNKIEKRVVIR
ncbi:MAG: C25 family cysteine peptidase [Candidatus Hydrothermia bacterium]